MEIGIQVSSLKPLLNTPEEVALAFRNMSDLGCRTVQLQWIAPSVSHEDIARGMAQAGIRSVSVQDFYTIIRENLPYYTGLNTVTGGKWLCISRIPEEWKSPDGLNAFIAELRQLQLQLDKIGQQLCFHPVSGDFRAVPGMDAVEYILEHMPELAICLDLYHLNRNCADMPGWIRRYGSRICMVHFKDAVGDELVPAGQGDTHWEGVLDACVAAGVPYAFVEQERWDRDPYDCLGEAMEWVSQEMQK